MKGYVFIYGVDGFGEDIAPAHEEGVYLDYDKAFNHLCELNKECLINFPQKFYEDGYSEVEYPYTDLVMHKAYEEEDWDTFDKELKKHEIIGIENICRYIIKEGEFVPYHFYSMEEIEIHE